MPSRARASDWKRRLRIAVTGLLAATVLAIPAWHAVQNQAPTSRARGP